MNEIKRVMFLGIYREILKSPCYVTISDFVPLYVQKIKESLPKKVTLQYHTSNSQGNGNTVFSFPSLEQIFFHINT
jgi:hypothetical protein